MSLENQNEEDKYNLIYGTKEFEYVWEKMIQKVFYTSKDQFELKATWELNYENRKSCSSKILPDSIMRSVDLNSNKTNYYILDAKYYKYGIYPERGENVLPQTSDIIKQIAYGDYISNELKKEKYDETVSTYNVFLSTFDSLNNEF
ncbi:LlaJI family restriction endonuclease [Mycoplasmopsis pullorum]|uniref:LlaJI family restriction endonuclease n=1 Tax=Mycoplasmopsis pullorum TaxID=48003 RepID=UPI002285D1E8|nr:LlaJI family restriction endonuclease [Mycoplasmopsis pullorum]